MTSACEQAKSVAELQPSIKPGVCRKIHRANAPTIAASSRASRSDAQTLLSAIRRAREVDEILRVKLPVRYSSATRAQTCAFTQPSCRGERIAL